MLFARARQEIYFLHELDPNRPEAETSTSFSAAFSSSLILKENIAMLHIAN